MYSPPPSELLGLRIVFFIISLIGLALTDFFYIATVINYAFQCQLIFCAINATVSRLSNRNVEVDHAIKVWLHYNLCIVLIVLYTYTGDQNTAGFFKSVEWKVFITSVHAIVCFHWICHFKYVCQQNTQTPN